jgi:hypothetical protein
LPSGSDTNLKDYAVFPIGIGAVMPAQALPFLDWVLTIGQRQAAALGYIALRNTWPRKKDNQFTK